MEAKRHRRMQTATYAGVPLVEEIGAKAPAKVEPQRDVMREHFELVWC